MREWVSERFKLAGAAVVLAGSAGFSAALAEETDAEVDIVSFEALLATPIYPPYRFDLPRYYFLPPVDQAASPFIPSIDFRDSSTIGRLKSIRQLSLLTIADSGKSRVFLGVNDDGVFGLHFGFHNGNQIDRFAEVMRMPYLQSVAQPQ